MAYADDVDFTSIKNHRNVKEMQDKLKPYQLKVNTDKTEYTNVVRKDNKIDEKSWRNTKK